MLAASGSVHEREAHSGADCTFHVLADQERVAAGPQAGTVELHDVPVVVERLQDANLLQTASSAGLPSKSPADHA
jgi:hypothetical protein